MFNPDYPISTKDEDLLEYSEYADYLAEAIISSTTTKSITMGIYGKWGNGKTSFVNLMIEYINTREYDDENAPIIVHFNPWNYANTDQILGQLFHTIRRQIDIWNEMVAPKLKRGLKTAVTVGAVMVQQTGNNISEGLKQSDPIQSNQVSVIATGISNLLKGLADCNFDENNDLNTMKHQISDKMRELDRKLYIVIDDIDRLTNTEIQQIFQGVKSIGDFDNTVYILLFDSDIVVNALKGIQHGDGHEYLEKIVQIPIMLPKLSKYTLISFLKHKVDSIVKKDYRHDEQYWNTILDHCISPFIKNLRDINRIYNIFSFQYELLKEETNFVDLLAVVTLEIFAPDISKWVYKEKQQLLSLPDMIDEKKWNQALYNYAKRNPHKNQDDLEINNDVIVFQQSYELNKNSKLLSFDAMSKLFNNVEKGNCYKQQRLASPDFFDVYFNLSQNIVKIPRKVVLELLHDSTSEQVIEKVKTYGEYDEDFKDIMIQNFRIFVNDLDFFNRKKIVNIILDGDMFYEIIDEKFYVIEESTYGLLKQIIGSLDAAEQAVIINSCLLKQPIKKFYTYVKLLIGSQRIHRSWGLSTQSYSPIFSEENTDTLVKHFIPIVEEAGKTYDLLILPNSYIRHEIFHCWIHADSPSFNKYINEKINSSEIYVIALISVFSSQHIPNGFSWEESWYYHVDLEKLQEFVPPEHAQEIIKCTHSTTEFSLLPEYIKEYAIGFLLWMESDKSDRAVNDLDINKFITSNQ